MKTLGLIGLASVATARERRIAYAPHGRVLTNVARDEFYRFADDPGEQHDLARQSPGGGANCGGNWKQSGGEPARGCRC